MGIDEEGQRLIFLVHLQGIYWGTGISLLKKKKIEARRLQFLFLYWLSQTLHFRAFCMPRVQAFMLSGLPRGGSKKKMIKSECLVYTPS